MKKDSKQRRFLSINKGKASNIVEKNKVVAVNYLPPTFIIPENNDLHKMSKGYFAICCFVK